jgi:hypothetical protein
MANAHTLTRATQTLTAAGVFTDTQTVVCGKTYTTQTTLTNVDGNVFKGADAAAGLQNLFDAINLTGTPGTQYAAAMTANAHVKATAVTATTLVITALTAGAVGNLIATTETQTNASWGAAVMAGGAGNLNAWALSEIALNQLNSDVLYDLNTLTVAAD